MVVDEGEIDSQATVRTSRNNVATKLAEHKRGLVLRDLTVNFKPSSVYGSRCGSHAGLLVIAKENSKLNVFTKTTVWKRRTLYDVEMAPISAMRRPLSCHLGVLGPQCLTC